MWDIVGVLIDAKNWVIAKTFPISPAVVTCGCPGGHLDIHFRRLQLVIAITCGYAPRTVQSSVQIEEAPALPSRAGTTSGTGRFKVSWELVEHHPLVISLSITSSVITVVGVVWKWPLVVGYLKAIVPAVLIPHSGRERRWITCRFCGRQGKVLTPSKMYGLVFETCGQCKGHGEILTDRWAQPDCAHCGGTARVLGPHPSYGMVWQPCKVCGGIGKRPFASAA
jgi:hypothetical protein